MFRVSSVLLVLVMCMEASEPYADTRKTPELVREFFSPSGEFRLVVTGHDRWANPRPSAVLSRLPKPEGKRIQVWKIDELHHRLGPGSVLISNDGIVVLVDEWIRTPSPNALTVIDGKGTVTSVYSFADIAKLTGKAPSLMVKSAQIGSWQSRKPVLEPDSMSIRFFTDDTYFLLDLKTGEIRAERMSD